MNGSGLVGSVQVPLRWAVDRLYLQDTLISDVIDRIVDPRTVRVAFLGGTSVTLTHSSQEWPCLTTLMVDLGTISNPSAVLRDLFLCGDQTLRFPSLTRLYLRRWGGRAGITVQIADVLLQRLDFLYIDGPLLVSGMEVVPKVHFGPNFVLNCDEPVGLSLLFSSEQQISADPLAGYYLHSKTLKTATHHIPFPEWHLKC